mmetsp:Transcript_1191/g.5040  ORF Transcript_1191/g.5040 Transcript_1191/m.5040 type:complete len:217 (-) Transcript_1191:21-671(-)
MTSVHQNVLSAASRPSMCSGTAHSFAPSAHAQDTTTTPNPVFCTNPELERIYKYAQGIRNWLLHVERRNQLILLLSNNGWSQNLLNVLCIQRFLLVQHRRQRSELRLAARQQLLDLPVRSVDDLPRLAVRHLARLVRARRADLHRAQHAALARASHQGVRDLGRLLDVPLRPGRHAAQQRVFRAPAGQQHHDLRLELLHRDAHLIVDILAKPSRQQ